MTGNYVRVKCLQKGDQKSRKLSGYQLAVFECIYGLFYAESKDEESFLKKQLFWKLSTFGVIFVSHWGIETGAKTDVGIFLDSDTYGLQYVIYTVVGGNAVFFKTWLLCSNSICFFHATFLKVDL